MKKKMPNQTDMNLQKQIAELQGIVITGFKGVHARQDLTNGRILKAEERIEKIERSDAFTDGVRKGISKAWVAFVAIMGILIGLLTAYATFYPHK